MKLGLRRRSTVRLRDSEEDGTIGTKVSATLGTGALCGVYGKLVAEGGDGVVERTGILVAGDVVGFEDAAAAAEKELGLLMLTWAGIYMFLLCWVLRHG